jgi:hypothetical protein
MTKSLKGFFIRVTQRMGVRRGLYSISIERLVQDPDDDAITAKLTRSTPPRLQISIRFSRVFKAVL